MKRTIIVLATAFIALGVTAQSQQVTREQAMKEFRQTIQKRDISKKHLETNIPLSDKTAEAAPLLSSKTKSIPDGPVWFPGEWEEVKAIVVTPYYTYDPATPQGTGYWTADPLVTGIAQYYKYSTMAGWQAQGMGPYKATMDTTSNFGKVFFYLMDGIQLGGAQAWVRIEQPEDSAKVIRTLTRMNLRHNNMRFIVGSGNSFWYRDCGPICFYTGANDDVAMLDFTYYPGRALDDSLPSHIHHQMGIPNYMTKVEWEGGNCLVDGAGMVISSDAIYENNSDGYGQISWDGSDVNSINYTQSPVLNRAQVKQALHDLLGQRATYILPAYRYDGGTGHIDLYADAWDENGFVFSIMPDTYSSWVDYLTGQRNIDSLCSYKSLFNRNYYIMGDIPFPSKDNGSNFTSQIDYNNNYTRTYSNHTFVNNVILQPCFSAVQNGQPSAQWDRNNIEALKAAYPGYTIYPVDVREFDGSGGAIHCVTKQIPADSPIRILHKNIHGGLSTGLQGSDLPVSAVITNNSGIAHAEVMYRINGDENWQTLNLTGNGNRWYGQFPFSQINTVVNSVEYYISATSNNGKTITKPMTASQGGYYSFSLNSDALVDSTMFDFDTLPMPMENITFSFGTNWATEDNSEPWHPFVGIEDVIDHESSFGQFYPNPACEQANLTIDLADGQSYNVAIVDLSGRTIHTSTLQAAGQIVYTINAGRLPAGVYHVVFQNSDSRIVRRLIVK